MSRSADHVAAHVSLEVRQIDQLFATYADLIERVRTETPTVVEMAALGSVLHSFYNGLENIFKSVAKGLDRRLPGGAQWHRELLTQMTQATAARAAVISPDLHAKLTDYLGFRHFFRQGYAFLLDWSRLQKLVGPAAGVWAQVKEELGRFLASLAPSDSDEPAG